MAIKEDRGWIWTPEEREWLCKTNGNFIKQWCRISESVKRFRKYLPDYAVQARTAARPFLQANKNFRKFAYQKIMSKRFRPMQPEAVKPKISSVENKMQQWKEFIERADVQDALRRHNRKAGEHNRKIWKLRRQQLEYEAGIARALDL